ncbi:MAG: hypothetical protein JW955_01595 [Sedimentisphaerales bacterium]|nr:hypothetical protein [Sedimentisphaerales bacterium]
MCHRIILPAVFTLLYLPCGVRAACETGGWDIFGVQLNGGGTAVTVGPGESVTVEYKYEVWNGTDCPFCRRQILAGLVKGSWSRVTGSCAFNAVPVLCPNKSSGSASAAFTAPSEVGTYDVVVVMDLQYTCAAAEDRFPSQGYRQTIGTVTVASAESVIAYDDGRPLNMELTESL